MTYGSIEKVRQLLHSRTRHASSIGTYLSSSSWTSVPFNMTRILSHSSLTSGRLLTHRVARGQWSLSTTPERRRLNSERISWRLYPHFRLSPSLLFDDHPRNCLLVTPAQYVPLIRLSEEWSVNDGTVQAQSPPLLLEGPFEPGLFAYQFQPEIWYIASPETRRPGLYPYPIRLAAALARQMAVMLSASSQRKVETSEREKNHGLIEEALRTMHDISFNGHQKTLLKGIPRPILSTSAYIHYTARGFVPMMRLIHDWMRLPHEPPFPMPLISTSSGLVLPYNSISKLLWRIHILRSLVPSGIVQYSQVSNFGNAAFLPKGQSTVIYLLASNEIFGFLPSCRLLLDWLFPLTSEQLLAAPDGSTPDYEKVPKVVWRPHMAVRGRSRMRYSSSQEMLYAQLASQSLNAKVQARTLSAPQSELRNDDFSEPLLNPSWEGYDYSEYRPGEGKVWALLPDGIPVIYNTTHQMIDVRAQVEVELRVIWQFIKARGFKMGHPKNPRNIRAIVVWNPHHVAPNTKGAHITLLAYTENSFFGLKLPRVYHVYSHGEDPAQGYSSHFDCGPTYRSGEVHFDPIISEESQYIGQFDGSDLSSNGPHLSIHPMSYFADFALVRSAVRGEARPWGLEVQRLNQRIKELKIRVTHATRKELDIAKKSELRIAELEKELAATQQPNRQEHKLNNELMTELARNLHKVLSGLAVLESKPSNFVQGAWSAKLADIRVFCEVSIPWDMVGASPTQILMILYKFVQRLTIERRSGTATSMQPYMLVIEYISPMTSQGYRYIDVAMYDENTFHQRGGETCTQHKARVKVSCKGQRYDFSSHDVGPSVTSFLPASLFQRLIPASERFLGFLVQDGLHPRTREKSNAAIILPMIARAAKGKQDIKSTADVAHESGGLKALEKDGPKSTEKKDTQALPDLSNPERSMSQLVYYTPPENWEIVPPARSGDEKSSGASGSENTDSEQQDMPHSESKSTAPTISRRAQLRRRQAAKRSLGTSATLAGKSMRERKLSALRITRKNPRGSLALRRIVSESPPVSNRESAQERWLVRRVRGTSNSQEPDKDDGATPRSDVGEGPEIEPKAKIQAKFKRLDFQEGAETQQSEPQTPPNAKSKLPKLADKDDSSRRPTIPRRLSRSLGKKDDGDWFSFSSML